MDSGLAAFAAIRKAPATYKPGSGERWRTAAPSSETCSLASIAAGVARHFHI
jgi:hypothetical protein